MQTAIIFTLSMAFWFWLDRQAERRGGLWYEWNYVIGQIITGFLALLITTYLWLSDDIGNAVIKGAATGYILIGAFSLMSDNYHDRQVRHQKAEIESKLEEMGFIKVGEEWRSKDGA